MNANAGLKLELSQYFQSTLLILLLITLGIYSGSVAANDALAMMEAVDARDDGDTGKRNSVVTLIDEKGKRSERNIVVFSKLYDGVEKGITFISKPARLKGTGFLTFDWDNPATENEAWIYLPDLRKVTRLSTANRADYFLGSDFTYGDLEGLEVSDFEYELKEAEPDKDGLYVINATPVSDRARIVIEKYGYTKITYWLDNESNYIIKAKYWLKSDGWIKYFKASKFESRGGIYVPGVEQMILTENGKKLHSTVLQLQSIETDKNIEDEIFTVFGLERGL